MGEYLSASRKKEIYQRAKGLCEYCLSPEKFSSSTFEIEHIFPRSLGGKKVLDNLALSCSTCNKHKSHRISIIDSDTKNETAFYNPRKDVWSDHFVWNKEFTEIIALTAKGRVTIKALKLNRKNLKHLRNLLRLVGLHPPN